MLSNVPFIGQFREWSPYCYFVLLPVQFVIWKVSHWTELLQRETPAMCGQRGKHNSPSSCTLRAKCPKLSKKTVQNSAKLHKKSSEKKQTSLGEQKQKNGAIHPPFRALFLLGNCSIKKKKSYHHLCLSCSFAFKVTHAKESFKTFLSHVLSK